MGLKITTVAMPGTIYVPGFRNNRQQPTEDQFFVEVTPMTAAEMANKRQRDLNLSKGINDKSWKGFRDSIITARCTSVEGVGGEDKDGKPIAVATGRDLVALVGRSNDAGMDDLLDEIYAAISDTSKLEEGRRPNS